MSFYPFFLLLLHINKIEWSQGKSMEKETYGPSSIKVKANLFSTKKGTQPSNVSRLTFPVAFCLLIESNSNSNNKKKIGTSWNETSLMWTCLVEVSLRFHRFRCGITVSSSSSVFPFIYFNSVICSGICFITVYCLSNTHRANGYVALYVYVRILFDSTGLMSIKC